MIENQKYRTRTLCGWGKLANRGRVYSFIRFSCASARAVASFLSAKLFISNFIDTLLRRQAMPLEATLVLKTILSQCKRSGHISERIHTRNGFIVCVVCSADLERRVLAMFYVLLARMRAQEFIEQWRVQCESWPNLASTRYLRIFSNLNIVNW